MNQINRTPADREGNSTLDTLRSLFSGIDKLVQSLKVLVVPRVEDMPYWTSPPIQFIYESTSPLVMGTYTWANAPTALATLRPLLDNAVYFFRNITLSADIMEMDYEAALVTSPNFNMYLAGDSKAILFREPITVNRYFEQFEYRLFWMPRRGKDQLFASFAGQLVQTPNLIGKQSITLKAIISAQEIINEEFIRRFTTDAYPDERRGGK